LTGPGLLIVIEGIDGVGKSTQANGLEAWLRENGHAVVRSKEPTDGPFGRKLRLSMVEGRLAPREELDLFLADRRQHVEELIAPTLAAGTHVLLDRYYFSTVAYQGARGFDPVDLLAENEAFAPAPDALLLLDMPAANSVARIRAERGAGVDTFEVPEALERSRKIFLELAQRADYALVLDADAPREEIQAAMRAHVGALLS
jgi:dTMP kinase